MLNAPPRHVPLSVVIARLFADKGGWLLFGFGMILTSLMALDADLSFITFRGALQQAEGEITAVRATTAKERRATIHQFDYRYLAGNEWMRGTSFSPTNDVGIGDRVTVEYVASDPSRSRIESMRRAIFPPHILFVVLFPIIGVILAERSLRRGWKETLLLRHGVGGRGSLFWKKLNEPSGRGRLRFTRPVYVLTYRYNGADGARHAALIRTRSPENFAESEMLLFDPHNPDHAFVVGPQHGVNVDSSGELIGNKRGWLHVVPAALALLVNLIVLLAR